MVVVVVGGGSKSYSCHTQLLSWVEVELGLWQNCQVLYYNRYHNKHLLWNIQGDSGSPLVYEDGGVCEVVGVVSWGWGCAREGVPGVFTQVSSRIIFYSQESWLLILDYLGWIADTITHTENIFVSSYNITCVWSEGNIYNIYHFVSLWFIINLI